MGFTILYLSLIVLIPLGVGLAALGGAIIARVALRPVDEMARTARRITAEDLSAGTDKVSYFEGTPIPTSVVPLGLVMAAFHHGSLYPVRVLGAEVHLVVLLFLLSGSLMISKTLRIPKP